MKTNDSPPCGCHLTKIWCISGILPFARLIRPFLVCGRMNRGEHRKGDMFLEHLNLGALAASRGLWNPNQFVAPRPAWCKCEQHMMNMEHHGSMWIFRMTSIAPVTRELPVPCWCESQVVWANWSGCEGGGPCHWHRFPDWAKVAEQNGTGWQLMEIKWRQGRIGRKRDAVSTNFALVVWGSNMGFLKMGDPQNQRFQD